MDIHENARLTPLRRGEMVRAVLGGMMTQAGAARVFGVSVKTVRKLVERFSREGTAGMADRSSRPAHMPRAMPAERELCGKVGDDGVRRAAYRGG
ncbi:MAG: leucine zipper domain-containing protein [Geminicoccaceae bacterium]